MERSVTLKYSYLGNLYLFVPRLMPRATTQLAI